MNERSVRSGSSPCSNTIKSGKRRGCCLLVRLQEGRTSHTRRATSTGNEKITRGNKLFACAIALHPGNSRIQPTITNILSSVTLYKCVSARALLWAAGDRPIAFEGPIPVHIPAAIINCEFLTSAPQCPIEQSCSAPLFHCACAHSGAQRTSPSTPLPWL